MSIPHLAKGKGQQITVNSVNDQKGMGVNLQHLSIYLPCMEYDCRVSPYFSIVRAFNQPSLQVPSSLSCVFLGIFLLLIRVAHLRRGKENASLCRTPSYNMSHRPTSSPHQLFWVLLSNCSSFKCLTGIHASFFLIYPGHLYCINSSLFPRFPRS